MAGDWIKMRSNLWDDPRVSRLVDETDSSEAAVVGALYWLWATADQHTADGVMPGLTLKGIDRKTGVKGFAQSLCDIGWLEALADGVRIVGFEEHNGASAKKRCQTAKRVANHTAANGRTTPDQQGVNASPTQDYQETNAACVSSALAREEKRREEKDNTHTAAIDQKAEEPDGSVCVLVCRAMHEAGIGDVNAGDATLAVLVGKGATLDAFVAAVPLALAAGKGFAYVLGVVKNRMTAAAALADTPLAVLAAAPVVRAGKPDVSRVTVPTPANADAELRRLNAEAAIPRSGPPAEFRQRMALRKAAAGAGLGA